MEEFISPPPPPPVPPAPGVRRIPFPSIGMAFILFIIFFAANGLAGVIPFVLGEKYEDLGFMIGYILGMGATYFIAWLMKKNSEGKVVHSFRIDSPGIFPFLLLATWAIVLLTTPVIELIPMPEWVEELLMDLLSGKSVWLFIAAVIAAPLFEELVFRGIILDGFLKRYTPLKAILWSAFFFGLFHLNPWQFLLAFTLGCLLGWVYYRTQSLAYCIAIHFFANGTSFLLNASLDESELDMKMAEYVGGTGPMLGILAAAALVLWLSLRFLDRHLPQAATGAEGED